MNTFNTPAPVLPLTIEGQTFSPNADGFWSLNEIHNSLGLAENKRPSQWNNEVRSALDQSGNFHLAHGGANPGTWATEDATIAYAMWVSTDFFLMVIHAFRFMRNDSILNARLALLAAAEADTKLAKAAPKADLIDCRLSGNGIPWGQACRLAGVTNSQLAKAYLVTIKYFVSNQHPDDGREVMKPKSSGFSGGFFRGCSTAYGNEEGFRVTAKGLAWLQGKSKEINAAVADRARRMAAQRRRR